MGSDDGAKTGPKRSSAIKDDGMPDMKPGGVSPLIALPMALGVTSGLGIAIAKAILTYGAAAKYAANADKLDGDAKWVYLGLFVFGKMCAFVNLYPAIVWKPKIMGHDGNLRSNPFIYRMQGKGALANAITFEEGGAVGGYNRANRSLQHLVENVPQVVAAMLATGLVTPFPTFCLVCLFCVGRIMHQVGYTTGYGYHGPGFGLSAVATQTLDGLCLLIAIKGF
ncbi:hypothetical protein M885DRAFT_584615 [Pelagophyceae sp. CCMP2097]|nr:hypothetical protein M885DRAFT_584615 [Pelagophyceae sp. CCMP2097]|mmetsp:Transcript_30325/g.106503  ORF Transcript_30325/g.106503 Transcript_30325/m.106503 type:complete len:224 (+) Transcript_30325:78-749(+)